MVAAPIAANRLAATPSSMELRVRYTGSCTARGHLASEAGRGPALNRHRPAKARFTEEVDIVAAKDKQLRIVGECNWTATPMPRAVLDDLREFKFPAIAQEKRLRVSKEGPAVAAVLPIRLRRAAGSRGPGRPEAHADPPGQAGRVDCEGSSAGS